MTTKTSSTKRTSAAKRTAKRTAKVESKAPEAKAGKAKASIGSYVVGILMSIFIGVVLPLMVRFFLEKLFSKKNRTFKASFATPLGKEEVEFAKEDVEAAGVAALLRRKEDEAAAAFDRAVAQAVKKASQGQKAPGLGM